MTETAAVAYFEPGPPEVLQGVQFDDLLEQAAALFDVGETRSTRTRTLDGINAETLGEAHREIEKSTSIGKLVIAA